MIKEKKQLDTYMKLFWVSAIVICGAIAFYVSLEARHTLEKLGRTNALIEEEKRNIDILKSEYAYLSRPEHLENLIKKDKSNSYQTASFDQFKSLKDFPITHEIEPLAIFSETIASTSNIESLDVEKAEKRALIMSNFIPKKKPIYIQVEPTKAKNNVSAAQNKPADTSSEFLNLLGGLTSN